jgi:hypothetical protein
MHEDSYEEYKSVGRAISEIVNKDISELQVGSKKDKLTSKQIAKKIKRLGKKSTLVGWDKIFSKFSPKELHSKIDLEGMLPDYIAGKDIEAIFAEDIDEEGEPTTAAAVPDVDRPLGKKKKDKEHEVLKRNFPQ